MITLRNTEPEDFEFRGPEGLDMLKKRIQMMANIFGECIFITGYAQTYRNLRLTPSSHFTPDVNTSILWTCWPVSFRYHGRYRIHEEDDE